MTTIPGRGFRSHSANRPAGPPTPRGMRPGTRPEGYGDTYIRGIERQLQSIADRRRYGADAGRPVRPNDRLELYVQHRQRGRSRSRQRIILYRPGAIVDNIYHAQMVGNPFNRPGYSGGAAAGGRDYSYGGRNYGTRGSGLGPYDRGGYSSGGFGGHPASPYR